MKCIVCCLFVRSCESNSQYAKNTIYTRFNVPMALLVLLQGRGYTATEGVHLGQGGTPDCSHQGGTINYFILFNYRLIRVPEKKVEPVD